MWKVPAVREQKLLAWAWDRERPTRMYLALLLLLPGLVREASLGAEAGADWPGQARTQ